MNSCQKQSEPISLDCVTNENTLELKFNDGEFGEWGGDEKTIVIYRKENHFFADYTERDMKSKTDLVPKITTSKKGIELDDRAKKLIIESINEIVLQKISQNQVMSNNASFSQIKLSDESFVLNISPISSKWTKFDELRKVMIQK